MSVQSNDIGLIGLGVMGRNLVLNMADNGFAVAAYNRTSSVTQEFASRLEAGQQVQPFFSLEDLVGSLKKPRRIMMMVAAGQAVDAVIGEVEPLLEPGDVIIDGGNSHFADTARRGEALEAKAIHLLGVGISGGGFGARHGPSMMPGGQKDAYESVRPIFEAMAARVNDTPCVAYLGPRGAGHYVKTVHNGIEYSIMQLIGETYALMKEGKGFTNEQLADIYAEWDAAELKSYLVEITSQIFRRHDEKTGGYVVDSILGEAEQHGTGMWTSQSAMDLHVPVPNIDIAVAMRNLSALEEERKTAAQLLRPARATAGTGLSRSSNAEAAEGVGDLPVNSLRNALYAALIITYAQGFAQLQTASKALEFDLRLDDVAAIWRGGCIIRSVLLNEIRTIFERHHELSNLMLDPELSRGIISRRPDLARTVAAGVHSGIPVPGMMAALAYLDAYRAEWLPLNLIQAQRDYFGSHTYRRIDEAGSFHTDWLSPEGGEEKREQG